MDPQRLLIDGELVAARRESENVNPATGEVAGTAPDAGAEEMTAAVGAARRAFDTTAWSTDVALRRRCLGQLQDGLRKVVEEIRPLLTAESGMPITIASMIGVDGPIEWLSWWTDLIGTYDWVRELEPKTIMGAPARRQVRKEAAGVVAAITPWNFPFQLNLTKVGAALAAGSTVVLKPAPDTPWSGTLLAAVAAETDLPPGVLNVVTTTDDAVAELLTTHPDVDHVTFTGSTAVGKLVMRNAADNVKRVSLELGGKSAAIVLDDADLPTAVGSALSAVCIHAGQGCAIPTRMLVPRQKMDEVAEMAATFAPNLPYGDPMDPGVLMGPIVNQRQYDRVLGYLEAGKRDARLVAGGGGSDRFDRGWWIAPTVFADVPADASIAREEIFGPVLSIVAHDGDDDAVRIANASSYGLSGAVYAGDVDRGLRVAERLRTGTVATNGAQWFDPASPFGGYKQSGLGREWGVEGLEDFLETKTVSYPA